MTASLTVCQSQPSSRATSATVRPRPADLLAPTVPPGPSSLPRAGAMRGSSPVHDPTAARAGTTSGACATPAAPADRSRQVDQLDRGPVLHPRRSRRTPARRPVARARHAPPTARRRRRRRRARSPPEANQQLAHARRVDLHRGSPDRKASEPPDSQSPCAAPGGPSLHAHTPLKSEAPLNVPGAELAAPVGVQDAAGDVTAPSDGHLDRGDRRDGLSCDSSIAQPTMRFENTSLIAHT